MRPRILRSLLALLTLFAVSKAFAVAVEDEPDPAAQETPVETHKVPPPKKHAFRKNKVEAAQTPVPDQGKTSNLSLYIDGGMAAPLSPIGFNKNWGVGVSGGIGLGLDVSKETSLILSLNYDFTPLSQPISAFFPPDTFIPLTGDDYGDFLFLLSGKFKCVADNPVDPYFLAGAGFSDVIIDDLRYKDSGALVEKGISVVRFAFSVGVGVDLRMGRSDAFFLESDIFETDNGEGDLMKGLFKIGLKTGL